MKENFILSCESTVDMPYPYLKKRNIPVIFYTYSIDGKEYVDDMLRDKDALPEFYDNLKNGKVPSTSQINKYRYTEYFEELLQKGNVLHIAFGSGMTPSVNNAVESAKELQEKYPDRKIIVIDSLCSSSGYGMLVDMAADMSDNGKDVKEIINMIENYCTKIHHQFFSTDIKYLKRSGRVSGITATVATVLGICPIMHLNRKGSIVAYDKVRGKKNAFQKTVDEMKEHAKDGSDYNGKCFICHSDCIDDAKVLKEMIKKEFTKINEIKIFDIGTIIASHSGAGTVAVFFVGDERAV